MSTEELPTQELEVTLELKIAVSDSTGDTPYIKSWWLNQQVLGALDKQYGYINKRMSNMEHRVVSVNETSRKLVKNLKQEVK